MKAITKEYLTDTIFRSVNKTIDKYRAAKNAEVDFTNYPLATDEELLDFIHSIPYFDIRLKDFLVGNLTDETIIISQTWEIEFLKKTLSWAESAEWLQGNSQLLIELYKTNVKKNIVFLTLPY